MNKALITEMLGEPWLLLPVFFLIYFCNFLHFFAKNTPMNFADLQECNFLKHIKQYGPWKKRMRLWYKQSARSHRIGNRSKNTDRTADAMIATS